MRTHVQSCFSLVLLFATAWTVAHLARLSMGFSRQEHWSGLPCPTPEDLPNPGIEPTSLHLLHGRGILYCLKHQGSSSLHTNIKLFLYPLYFWQIDSLCRYFIRFLLKFFFFLDRTTSVVGLLVQLLSCVRLCEPWTAAHQASLSITNSQSLCKLMSVESVRPSNHLTLCHPLLLLHSIFPSIRVFSNESLLRIRGPKYWSFSFSISPSNEYSD